MWYLRFNRGRYHMAYVSKEKKAKIVLAAKAIIPKGWKVTFSVEHHMSIVATIQKAPASVLDDCLFEHSGTPGVNEFHLPAQWKGETLKVLENLRDALNTDNFDKSDIMSDYFHVGHYVTIQFGRWNKRTEFVG